MSKDDRLDVLLDHLQRHTECVLQVLALAQRLGVTKRSVYRYLDVLRDRGHRIDGCTGYGGGVMLRRRRRVA